jgi:hypothetical protein
LNLTDNELASIELVRRELEVKRSRALADAARGIVVRAVARAEPAAELTSARNRDTTQVGANSEDNEPLRVALDSVKVSLGILQRRDVNVGFGLNFRLGSVADEYGLSTPLNSEGGALCDAADVKLGGGKSKHIGGGAHGGNKL